MAGGCRGTRPAIGPERRRGRGAGTRRCQSPTRPRHERRRALWTLRIPRGSRRRSRAAAGLRHLCQERRDDTQHASRRHQHHDDEQQERPAEASSRCELAIPFSRCHKPVEPAPRHRDVVAGRVRLTGEGALDDWPSNLDERPIPGCLLSRQQRPEAAHQVVSMSSRSRIAAGVVDASSCCNRRNEASIGNSLETVP